MSRNEGSAPEPVSRRRRDEPAAIPGGSLGSWLLGQREARGVTLREIADASKISMRYLEALEADRFDALPAPVFVRGFLREYARIVGLDPDEAVNLYLMASKGERGERDGGPIARSAAVAPPPRSVLVYGVVIAVVLVLLLLVAAAVSYWLGRGSAAGAVEIGRSAPRPTGAATARGREATAPGAAAPQADEPPGEQPPQQRAERPAGDLPEVPQPQPRAAEQPPSEAAATAVQPAEAASPAAMDAPLRVVLEFQRDCWVELVIDGRRRESELKAGGETWAIEAKDSVLLTLGNAPAVRVEVDGRAFPLQLDGSRVVRELRIDRAVVEAARRGAGSAPGT